MIVIFLRLSGAYLVHPFRLLYIPYVLSDTLLLNKFSATLCLLSALFTASSDEPAYGSVISSRAVHLSNIKIPMLPTGLITALFNDVHPSNA